MTRSHNWLVGFLGVLVVGGIVALARPAWMLSYQEMTEKSDLVVIATPVARKELPGRTVMPGVRRGNEPIPAVQVETTFDVSVVLRGQLPADQKQFTLLHLLEPPSVLAPPDALDLVDFQLSSRDEYLLFLKRRDDGRYEAMTGQTDPAFSIRKLVPTGVLPTTRP